MKTQLVTRMNINNAKEVIEYFKKNYGAVVKGKINLIGKEHTKHKEDIGKVGHCFVELFNNGIYINDVIVEEKPTNNQLIVHTTSAKEAEEIFKTLSKDAKEVTFEITDAFYFEKYGKVIDKFGISWEVIYSKAQKYS